MAGPPWDEALEKRLTEGFRRRVLRSLRKEERLSVEFHGRLLTFAHGGGFSVFGRHLILDGEPARLAHIARCAIRPPVALDRVSTTSGGKVLLSMPEGHGGAGEAVVLDPLGWIRRVSWHIPDHGRPTVRYHGAHANRSRALYRPATGDGTAGKPVAARGTEPKPESCANCHA